MLTRRNKSGDMRHINHQIRTDCTGNLGELGKIYCSRICRGSCNNELGLAFVCLLIKFFIIYEAVIVSAVGNEVEILSGNVDR